MIVIKLLPYILDFNPAEQVGRVACKENTRNVSFLTLAVLMNAVVNILHIWARW